MKKKLIAVVFFVVAFFLGKNLYRGTENTTIAKVNEFYYAGEYEKAKGTLKSYLKDHPDSPKCWSYLGLVNVELSDTLGAEQAYKKALALDNESERSIVGLGVIERMKGNYARAIVYYERALQLNPDDSNVYTNLSVVEIKNRNFAKAIKLGEIAKEKDDLGKNPVILSNLVIAYHLNHQNKERDQTLIALEKTNYQNMEQVKMLISGKINDEDVLNSL
ncbi:MULTISPECIES: tetratricopeptide repeat protein [unclassified Pedobacter]|uniref:tetratricopeptide repeat protein n=1 Tax=unclassified Pedobacter TaxID=2628915 RepID=UPI001422E6E5|nr:MULTISPECIES: tetratricopeptide repeat protein [unclassified Pedobacter]NII82088.1 tetratricopeptide (TPR) repeat protein [Pedobacter sp. SG908]NMN36095.1 tetratricopeptide (TPR) repeat protein [Pedobacter sp. SG918]